MEKLSSCPHLGDLKELAAGRQSPADMESLVRHLEQCDQCLDMVRTLSPSDTLIETLGQARLLPLGADEPTVTRLMERLAKIAQPGSLDTSLESTREEGARAAAGEETWDFLAPAQGPDELGRLGPYRVLHVLGRGGMGVVFQAEDPKLERVVALKAMLPALATSPSAKKRFLREAKAAAAVTHDHIVRILEVGEDRGVPFLAMEFLEGEPLDARLKRGPLALDDVLRVGRQVAEGLVAAHDRGLIHRDIKPANIWLEQKAEGGRRKDEKTQGSSFSRPPAAFRVKILDFGLARSAGEAHLTRSGAILGTPAYMAPEQASGELLDQRCDLFSLGCVLYRLSTGELPFKGKNTLTVLAALANTTPAPPRELNPRIPAQLSDLIVRLLAKDRDQRPASAHQVVEALDACPAQESTEVLNEGARMKHEKRHGSSFIPHLSSFRVALAVLVVAVFIVFLRLPGATDDNGENKPVVRPQKQLAVDNVNPIEKKTPAPSTPPDYALVLDGNCAALVPSLKLDRSGPLTIEAHVSVRKADDRNPIHLAGVPQQFSLFTGATQAMDGEHLSLGVQYEGSFQHLFDPDSIPLGRRVHLAGVRAGRSIRLYMDGKLISSRGVEEPLLNDPKNTFLIGNNGVFDGTIDEVRVSLKARYDRDFTPAKRFQPDNDTLALYHLDEGEGAEVKDASGNNHHGTIHGNARWVKADGTPIAPAP